MTRSALTTAALLAFTFTACQTTEPEPDLIAATPPAPIIPEGPPPLEITFPNRELIDYTIQPGDSLWLIAENHKIPVADIRAANEIAADDNKIVAGKTLKVPLPEAPATATPVPAPDLAPDIGLPVNLSPSLIPDSLTPSTLPGTIAPPPSRPVAPPNAESGLPAPPVPSRD